MNKLSALTLLLFCCINQLFGQLQVTGTIKQHDGKPAQFVNVIIKKVTGKDSIIKTTLTDSTGAYHFFNVDSGAYSLYVQAQAHLKVYKTFIASGGNLNLGLGPVTLDDKSIALSEVKVVGTKNFLERKIDRLVINIENSVLANGNTTWDILGKLPGVLVQRDIISVNGSNSVSILIDGKPGSTVVLKSLQSSSIEKIEIITNPSAAFDAQGENIINIVLKKDRMFSDVGVSYHQRVYPVNNDFGAGQNSGSVSSNLWFYYKKLRIASQLSYNLDRANSETEKDIYNTPDFILTNGSKQKAVSNYINSNVSLGYDFSGQDIMDVQISLYANPYGSSTSGYSYSLQKFNPITDSLFTNTSKYINNSYQPSAVIGFTHYLDKKRQDFLSVTAIYGQQHYFPASSFFDTGSGLLLLQQKQDYTTFVSSLKADYRSVHKTLSTSYGVKYTDIGHHDIAFVDGPLSDDFKFNEKILAEYVNVSGKQGKLSYQLGLRDEFTHDNGLTANLNSPSVIRDYNNLFPSFALLYNLKNSTALNFSITRRITRPGYDNFNPYQYISASGQYLTRGGNPNLLPQYAYKYEVSYTIKGLTFLVNYQDKSNVRSVFANKVVGDTINTEVVNTRQKNFVGSVSYSKELFSWWNSIINANVYDYNSYLLQNVTRHSVSFYAFTDQTFTLSPKTKFNLNFLYISPSTVDYYTVTGHVNLNLAVITTFGKQANYTLTTGIDDILGTNKYNFINNYGPIVDSSNKLSNDRMFRVALAYRFKTSKKFQPRSRRPDDFGEIRY